MCRHDFSFGDERSRRRFIADAAKALLGVGVAPMASQVLGVEFPALLGRPARAQSVVYLNLMGGVSHIDTFDPKPNQPEIQGPVKPLATNVPGIHVTEYLPKIAGQMDKLAVIRSMTSHQGDHIAAQYLLHRSHQEGGTLSHPTLAAWAMRSLNKCNPDLPGSVSIAGNDDSVSTGFLDLKYAPVPIGDPSQGLPDSRRPAYVSDSQLESRLSLTRAFNQEFHERYHYRQTIAHARMFADAVRLMRSRDLKAFDISQEPAPTSAQYGPHPFGQGCMLARRLVEHGLRFVEVGFGGWDTHYDNFGMVAENSVVLDQSLSALLVDLKQRGMLESTLVVVATEFGRTPKINEAHKDGRDHHPNAFSCLMAGGGVDGGQVYGETDAQGAEVIDRGVSIPDLNATIGWALGLPIDEQIASPSGQLFRIADEGQPLKELFS
ncbi:MAG: DUF1501 domain-containing protein [Pirellulales bacterium]